MGSGEARKAQRVLHKAREGAIRRGHLGLYQKLKEDLEAARERLAGRKELLRFDEIRRALDAKIEELTAVLQDPSVADHVAISEGVYELLNACQPLYLALNDGLSVKEACDALDAAGAVLDHFADEDAAYKKYRKLNGGWVAVGGRTNKRVKLNAKAFAKWQTEKKQTHQNFKQNPYQHTAQTPEAHIKTFGEKRQRDKNFNRRVARRTKEALAEDEEQTPSELQMRVMACKTKKYCVKSQLFKYAPAGYSNGYTTKKKAQALAALCEANRPAGTTREEVRDARAQKGLPDGVTPHQGGYKAQVTPKKNTHVRLAAPDGGSVFDTAEAAAKAIKDYEDAGSPTTKSHPLVKYVNRS